MEVQHRAPETPAAAFGLNVPGQPVGLAGGKTAAVINAHQAAPSGKGKLGALKGSLFSDAVIQTDAGQTQSLTRPGILGGHRQKTFGFFPHDGLTSCNFTGIYGTI